jgi:hypothetical protein
MQKESVSFTSLRSLRWLPVVIMSWLIAGAGCGAAPETASAPAPNDSIVVSTSVATSMIGRPPSSHTPDMLTKPTGKLSAVLTQLAQPLIATQSAEQQDQALGMQATGPGSLMRNDKGQVLVVVRVSEVSDATLAALRNAGATVVNTAETYRSVTVYISPDHLNGLAAVPGVENIHEEVRSS